MRFPIFEEGAGVNSPYAPVYTASPADVCGGAATAAEAGEDAPDDWRARHDFFEEY